VLTAVREEVSEQVNATLDRFLEILP